MSDEFQSIPVAAVRAAVQASGQLEGIEGPLFLADNESEWLPYFISRYDPAAHPLMAKVIVTRRGQKPREVVISWDEYAEDLELNDPAWAEKRKQKPMSIFGAEVERHGYKVVFADVVAAAFPPEPFRVPDEVPAAGWDLPARDWFAEVKAADAQKLNALYDEAREAGALAKVDGLQAAIMDRMLTLGDPRSAPKPTAPRPQGQPRRRRSKPKS